MVAQYRAYADAELICFRTGHPVILVWAKTWNMALSYVEPDDSSQGRFITTPEESRRFMARYGGTMEK